MKYNKSASVENTKFSWKQDKILVSIVDELKKSHHCHTIILYGSRARGDFSSNSDYDVVGITSKDIDMQWLASFDKKHNVFLDIFVFSEKELLVPNESHLHMSDGVVLIESNGFGTDLLKKLNVLISQPAVLSDNELKCRSIWYQKMLARAKVGDVEGQYRQIWTIHTLLEDYFAFRGMRFLGPKKAFQYLKEHDQDIFVLFEKVLANPKELVQLKQLVDAIVR